MSIVELSQSSATSVRLRRWLAIFPSGKFRKRKYSRRMPALFIHLTSFVRLDLLRFAGLGLNVLGGTVMHHFRFIVVVLVGFLAVSCKQRSFNSDAVSLGLTQQGFEQQFEVTRLTTCQGGGDLRLIWRVRRSDGRSVVPYVLGFGGDGTTKDGRRVRFQVMTASASTQPLPSDATSTRFDPAEYSGFDLQIPPDERAARWGYLSVDGQELAFSGSDVGRILIPTQARSSASARVFHLVTTQRDSLSFDCSPLDSQSLARLKTFAVRDGSHGFRGDRGVVVRSGGETPDSDTGNAFVTQWSCAGNRRKAIDHRLQPVSGGWLNQEEYCEWDRNGVAPERVSSSTARPEQLQCVIRTSFDQKRTYFLQQRLYAPAASRSSTGGSSPVDPLKSSFYDTKFNGYAFLVGGTEGYHVWDTRVWKKMGERGDPRGAYITDRRKGIIGHCMQFSCSQPDETGYTGNCVAGRQSDPLICNVVNSLYCSGAYADESCKQSLELNLTRRPIVHADPEHIRKSASLDPVITPQLRLPPAPLFQLTPVPVVREDVLFRSDYTPPTQLGDTPIKLDLIVPDTLPECRYVVDPTLLKNKRVADAEEFLRNDKTLVQCLFVRNETYHNCDEVAAQIQARLVFETQPKTK